MKQIYLVRHGDIGLGHEKRYIGVTDLALSEAGREQAHFLKEYLSSISFERSYCSPLMRSRETADIITTVQPISPIVQSYLKEVNMGDWEGKLFTDIRNEYPLEYKQRGEDIANYRPPCGESFSDCYQRVIPPFESMILSNTKNILVVGHAGINRVILCYALGLPLNHLFKLKQSYGCLNILLYDKKRFQLKTYFENPVHDQDKKVEEL
ncbi:alpha-ribazole phosphatase [Desulfosporosinus fructosivorans]|uniref:Alpha-ribazole phosphatase n=1 Tax=Desulfosporosinus fructosivorans TaxID=2018669 RepID=A0A4Z0RAX6_9FIRM|nr:alpha-ribazole phosphatase [Desulfosporosinus fructosivorans]TGE39317.1 alpha-ribazole phosphatase [Desulfosporosinus fructosivorans]